MVNKISPLAYLLSILSVDYPANVDINALAGDSNLFRKVADLATRNGLFYYFIMRVQELGIEIPRSQQQNWTAEKINLQQYSDTLEIIARVSKDAGFRYAVIKACSSVPHIPRDIDILVQNKDREMVLRALQEAGMTRAQSGMTETALKWTLMRVDIYTNICYMGINFFNTDHLLNPIVEDEIFNVRYPALGQENSFLLMLVHSIFGHRSVSLLDLLHMKALYLCCDKATCFRIAETNQWKDVYSLALEKFLGISARVNNHAATMRFPYIIEQKLIVDCLHAINRSPSNIAENILLRVTLLQEEIAIKMNGTKIYKLIRTIEPARNLFNSCTAYAKELRGDKKSIG